jgi:hypothetical protein
MENQTQYYLFDGQLNSVRSWDGKKGVQANYYEGRQTGWMEISDTPPRSWSNEWQPTTREVFEATRAKVLELLRKEGAI